MRYTTYGKSGVKVSKLGFGAMRLPVKESSDDDHEQVDYDKATELIRKCLDSGINFIDTHHGYHSSQSETAIGYATEGIDRSSFIIQTKTSTWRDLAPGETYRQRLEGGLARAKTNYFDFYLMHSLNWDTFVKVGEAFMKEAHKAREEGLIRHVGMSTHDKPENVKKLIDTGMFECMLCQYSLIDLTNEGMIEYAHSKGLGVSVMGPVGGGRLATPSEITGYLPGGKTSGAEAALRFVLANPNVDVAVSGMSAVQHVIENVATANIKTPLSAKEKARIQEVVKEKAKLADLYCTGCEYCMPCPNNVNIARIFELMNWKRIYGIEGKPREYYAGLVKKKRDASCCIECAQCEPKCPQKIKIIAQLKECKEELS
jgi:uncharacterized protein